MVFPTSFVTSFQNSGKKNCAIVKSSRWTWTTGWLEWLFITGRKTKEQWYYRVRNKIKYERYCRKNVYKSIRKYKYELFITNITKNF